MPPSSSEPSRWFAAEVLPHETSLRSYLRGKFPDHPDLDDLVQETYARLLAARARGAIHQPKSFLFTTARNAAYDFFRRRKAAPVEELVEIERLPVMEDAPDVAESVCHDQELQMLDQAIQALPERCRQIVVLRKLHGLSHREIAEQLGISAHTVNAQIAIGVLRLRDQLRARGLTKGGL